MTNQIEEGIDLRPKSATVVPRVVFDQIIQKVKNERATTQQLSEEFNYSTTVLSFIRSRAIALGLLERPPGVDKMMQVKAEKKALGLSVRKKSSSKTKEVSKNIKITTPIEKDFAPTSKFVNIKFGEIEVVVEKSANIIITKDKIVIN